jgi:hypothetical protein
LPEETRWVVYRFVAGYASMAFLLTLWSFFVETVPALEVE